MPNDHICALCAKVFPNRDSLLQHVLIHMHYPLLQQQPQPQQQPQRDYHFQLQNQFRYTSGTSMPQQNYGGEIYRPQRPNVDGSDVWLSQNIGSSGWLSRNFDSSAQIEQENIFGVVTTTHTQTSEDPNGDIIAVSTVTSSLGSAIVTTTQSTVPPITTTRVTVSQASGTISSTTTNASCPGPEQAYNNECPICLRIFKDDEKTITAPCNHRYHNECISGLADAHANGVREYFNCAICREEILYKWLYK